MKNLLLLIVLFPAVLLAQKTSLKTSTIGNGASFRGLSVVDNKVVWVAGNHGTVCISTDGGINFNCQTVAGYDSAEFRSVYAFDATTAIVCNTGSPAKILRTEDGGLHWNEVYSNDYRAAFIDGIDFWNANDGIVLGDPLDGMMMILVTHDGGKTWSEIPEEARPQLVAGEASFAASGTTIRCKGESKLWIATGGVASRLFNSNDKGLVWEWVPTPIIQGSSTQGVFSFNFYDDKHGVIVGGDYQIDTLTENHIFLTTDGGNNWQRPSKPTRGYRECVEYVSDKMLVAVGPTGIDISINSGLAWEPFSDEKKFHVVRKARNGKLVVIAGGAGKIGVLSY